MRHSILVGVLVTLLALPVPVFSQGVERAPGSRIELLDDGGAVVVPEGVMTVPGQPLVVPDLAVKAMQQAAESLAARGFVEAPNEYSRFDQTFGRVKQRLSTAAANEDIGAYALGNYDRSKLAVRIGEVKDEYVRPGSENFVIPSGSQRVTRVYSDTDFGPLYIQEFFGATLKFGAPQRYNYSVAGLPANITTVKFASDKWATMLVVAAGDRVLEFEAGSRIAGAAQEGKFADMVGTLISLDQD